MIVRVVAWAILALLGALFGIGRAHAHAGLHPSQGEAYSHCMTDSAALSSSLGGSGADCRGPFARGALEMSYTCYAQNGPTGAWSTCGSLGGNGTNYWYPKADACEYGTIDSPPGCAPSPEECLARNDALGSGANSSRPSLSTSHCVAGCEFAMVPPFDSTSVNGTSIYRGLMKYNGNACAATPPPEYKPDDPPPQECVQASAGQTMCIKPDGGKCYTAARTGRQICWGNGETGEKTDGPDMQKRDAGQNPQPPASPQLPSGDTLEPVGPPINATTNEAGGNVVVTTTQNYTTVNGTNAGSTQQGEPADGTGEPDGEEDGEEGSASGGGDCVTPPVCSGDALQCFEIQQRWSLACHGYNEADAAVSAFSSGATGEWSDGGPPDNSDHLGADGQGDLHKYKAVIGFDGDDLDASGFLGAGSCPVFETPMVGPVPLPIDMSKLCDMLANVGNLVLAVSYIIALRIIGGQGRR